MKIGIVISVFDKIEELEISLVLAEKANFDEILVVCENDAPIARIQELRHHYRFQIKVVESIDFKFSTEKFKFYQSITPRVWEAQRQGLLELANKVDFIMHTHSDGWILKGSTPRNIIDEMNQNNFDIAYRGVGLTYQNLIGSPTGTIDDHFYLVRSRTVLDSLFLKKPMIDYIPGLFNIHGILSLWIISEIGLSKSYHYDNTREWVNWDGSIRNFRKGNPLRSYVLNEDRGLLHCHADDFPRDTGKALQVRDLKRYISVIDSDAINGFISKYEDLTVTSQLELEYHTLRKRLKLYLDFDEDYKNLAVMRTKLQNYNQRVIATLSINLIKLIGSRLKNMLGISLKATFYPKTISEVYAKSSIPFKNSKENKVLKKVTKN